MDDDGWGIGIVIISTMSECGVCMRTRSAPVQFSTGRSTRTRLQVGPGAAQRAQARGAKPTPLSVTENTVYTFFMKL